MNKALLVGRITTKPELRTTSSGIPFTRFSVAINRPFTNNGERTADFINILVWRKQAENVCNFLDKGSQVAIEGRIQTGSYTDKDGNNRTSFEVVADNVQFLDSKSQRSNESQIPISDGVDIGNDTYSEFGESVSIDDNFLE
ncbi:MAG: single-stranded DNA-binding protein [Firmicutes bacterium]|jgi:single-strand DNA-binding protein|nr:single-stranded DNA-binding protein [Bacillota bacterium]